ncbi:hypothetical protein J6590_049338 [Homalodisca vitripennis]|nr:hypothetical protein J6590_049338 [Homalodisca vitripennis]
MTTISALDALLRKPALVIVKPQGAEPGDRIDGLRRKVRFKATSSVRFPVNSGSFQFPLVRSNWSIVSVRLVRNLSQPKTQKGREMSHLLPTPGNVSQVTTTKLSACWGDKTECTGTNSKQEMCETAKVVTELKGYKL